jgi:hypothetical protein
MPFSHLLTLYLHSTLRSEQPDLALSKVALLGTSLLLLLRPREEACRRRQPTDRNLRSPAARPPLLPVSLCTVA